MPHNEIVGLYERHARDFDRDRSRSLVEKAWLDRFLAGARPGGTVLDVGCGMGEPMANGFTVVAHLPDDPACGGHTVWLATYRSA